MPHFVFAKFSIVIVLKFVFDDAKVDEQKGTGNVKITVSMVKINANDEKQVFGVLILAIKQCFP
jgi:hypothetical protein